MKAVRVNLFGGSSTKQRPDSEPRSLGDHGSVFRFLGSQLEGKILRGPMWCGALGAEVLGHRQQQLTQTLIVRLLKTHLFYIDP